MPYKDFVQDLKKAQHQALPPNILSIAPGDDDGTILLVFRVTGLYRIQLYLQITDPRNYPKSHSFVVFSDSEDVPTNIALELSKAPLLDNLSVSQAVAKLAAALTRAAAAPVAQNNNVYTQRNKNPHPQNGGRYDAALNHWPDLPGVGDRSKKAISDRVQQDLTALKTAGFRVSHAGNILEPGASCSLMVSIRIRKLGIPDNALEAWRLLPSDYLMLLLHYDHGYCSMDELRDSDDPRKELETFIFVTKKHKLTPREILHATKHGQENISTSHIAEMVSNQSRNVRPLFIGLALEKLLNEKLLELVISRLAYGFNWTGAMTCCNETEGQICYAATTVARYLAETDVSKIKNLPQILQADHVETAWKQGPTTLSLPCAAMQLVLRHVVRCTEFCLVCFERTNDIFEALKPYVCSRPFCLLRYMCTDLGPSIEFEILSQRYVVDLLISFCYEATWSNNMTSLPIGLDLIVPDMELIFGNGLTQNSVPRSVPVQGSAIVSNGDSGVYLGEWSASLNQIVLIGTSQAASNGSPRNRLIADEWLTFWSSDLRLHHCQVTEVLHPVYQYTNLITSKLPANSQPATLFGSLKITIVPHRKMFDNLSVVAQRATIRVLLETIPSVDEMASYLHSFDGGFPVRLSKWTQKLIPSAFAVLRWVVTSNRSCIIQEPNERSVHGMPGYLQFRFVSGAPDKESRFVDCVHQVKTRLKQAHSTIFAWHGSVLENWHSIVREGLRFEPNRWANGRSYGHGVYHSLDADTSIAYSTTKSSVPRCWPSSMLRVQHALCLNEIVNAPKEFQSSNPHLVVQHIDWIQTRYLFVKCGSQQMAHVSGHQRPVHIMAQDLTCFPKGIGKAELLIPDHSKQVTGRFASAKNPKGGRPEESDDSDTEDVVLYSATQHHNVTPFRPGSLNRANLPTLPLPKYATSKSTKAIQRQLKLLQKEQQDTARLAELGWYLDPNHIDNVYQWIVELHSFDLELPLAKDMQELGVQSIVIELRFGGNFNASPPFVRIIRPRFIEFAKGGGGHVTAGGALCMQLLTSDGWNPSSTMSAVLLQIRMAITSMDPHPARLDRSRFPSEYGTGEAAEAYQRACRAHGWKVPNDFAIMVAMTESVSISSSSTPLQNGAANPTAPVEPQEAKSNKRAPITTAASHRPKRQRRA